MTSQSLVKVPPCLRSGVQSGSHLDMDEVRYRYGIDRVVTNVGRYEKEKIARKAKCIGRDYPVDCAGLEVDFFLGHSLSPHFAERCSYFIYPNIQSAEGTFEI